MLDERPVVTAAAAAPACPPAASAPPRSPLDARLGRVRPWILSVLLFVVCVAVYASNGKTLNTGDSVPTRLIPIALVLDGTPMLDRFASVIPAGAHTSYFVRQTPYGLASWYPIATGLVATPIVAPAVLWIQHTSAPDAAAWLVIGRGLEKLAAIVIAALAVVVFLPLCRRLRVPPFLALLVTVTFAFGSQLFSTASQALWQHGPGCLAILAALLCLVSAAGEHAAAPLAGFSALAALAVAIRPNDLLIVAPFALLALWRHPRYWLALVAPATLGAVLLVSYNLALFATPSGGYGTTMGLHASLGETLPGLLLSPGRGLFVYFPVSLLLVLLLALEPRVLVDGFAAACLAAVVGALLFTASWPSWWGGYSFGPRLLSEIQPIILLLLALGIGRLEQRGRRRAFVLATAVLLPVQVAIQVLGTYGPAGRPPAALAWNETPISVDLEPMRNWDLADSPLARGLRGYE